MIDQKKARQQYQNAVNNAQGQAFEGYIKAGCEYYRLRERAEIDKTPEPFRVTSKHGNGVFTGRFTARAQPDFQGTLAEHTALGAVAAVCGCINSKFFFIPWDIWRDMKEHYGRQYVTAQDLEPYRVKFTGAVMFLDYVHERKDNV